jgi:ribosomal protein S27E
MDVQHFSNPQSGFKIVCSDCGSLSIKVADPATAPATTSVNCGVCGAVRGSLADLHDLARRGTDLFEF